MPVAPTMVRAKLFGRCEPKTGIVPFGRLVDQVMTSEPCRSARRVFWIVDNGSSHRGQASIERLEGEHPTLRLIHLPVHASWLNQVEIYSSILGRKVLTRADAVSLDELAARILAFQADHEVLAQPFEWKFIRADLAGLIDGLAVRGAGPVRKGGVNKPPQIHAAEPTYADPSRQSSEPHSLGTDAACLPPSGGRVSADRHPTLPTCRAPIIVQWHGRLVPATVDVPSPCQAPIVDPGSGRCPTHAFEVCIRRHAQRTAASAA